MLDGLDDELAQRLVEQGYLSYDDLSVIEPDALMEMGGLTMDQVNHIVDQADLKAEEAERAAAEERRRRREQEKKEAAAAAAAAQSEDDQETSDDVVAGSSSGEPEESGDTAADQPEDET
jgi:N utilization substance protein A